MIPQLSVILCVYNNAPYLPAAIESICGQTFGDFEFLIVNDGSTDGSGEIIDRFAAADPRIRPIHQENRGFVASLNRAIGEARAPLIARMDGDDICAPERFAVQCAFLKAHPDHGVVGSQMSWINADGSPRERDILYPTGHNDFLRAIELHLPLMSHPSVIMRRDIVMAQGNYRPIFRACEDYDLWLRVSEVTKLTSLPERLYTYRIYEDQVSSRHIVEQAAGAAIAYQAHIERLAGRPDPTKGLETLPAIGSLDRLFKRSGVSRAVRAEIAPKFMYSATALRGSGYDVLLDYIRDGAGPKNVLWRTSARLMKLGLPGRSFRMALTLAVNR